MFYLIDFWHHLSNVPGVKCRPCPQNLVCRSAVCILPPANTWRHQQNCKYITYHSATR